MTNKESLDVKRNAARQGREQHCVVISSNESRHTLISSQAQTPETQEDLLVYF